MPKGLPNKNTIRVDRYQQKAGYKAKTFKLKADIVEKFMAACEAAGVGQAATITALMQEFIDRQSKSQG